MLGLNLLWYYYSIDKIMIDQQERSDIASWIVGFTDGEGCFSVSMFQNKTTKFGWQVFPEFVITQGMKSLPALEVFRQYFQCGKIYINKRYDNHHEHLYRYCVRMIEDLSARVIPFFRTHNLYTAKQDDFEIFAEIVQMLLTKTHHTQDGLRFIATRIQAMNRKKPSVYLKSLETKRHAPHRLCG